MPALASCAGVSIALGNADIVRIGFAGAGGSRVGIPGICVGAATGAGARSDEPCGLRAGEGVGFGSNVGTGGDGLGTTALTITGAAVTGIVAIALGRKSAGGGGGRSGGGSGAAGRGNMGGANGAGGGATATGRRNVDGARVTIGAAFVVVAGACVGASRASMSDAPVP